jgi:multidrug efflux pump subunit AcrB
VRHRLPEDLLPLRIKLQDRTSNQWLMNVLVERVDPANPTHRQAVQTLAERLGRVPNVVAVKSSLPRRDIYIRFDPRAMARTGIDVTLARQRILEYLGHLPVGAVRVRDQEVAIELQRSFGGLDDLRRLPLLVNRVGRGTRLGQVARVEFGFAQEHDRQLVDGQRDFVELEVVNSAGSDVIAISAQVRQALAEEAPRLLPEPLRVRIGSDASEIIDHELETLKGNGLGGVVIVLVILMAFLGWRVSLMTAIGLPFSYLGVVLALQAFGIDFNLISLVAMILVIGILVDDAIIVSEEFCQRLHRGASSRDAAIEAVLRVGKPVLGMVATTTVAFLPLVVLQSDASWLVRPLPIVIIAALFLSAFESFFLLPNHLRHLMPSGARLRERRFVVWGQRGFRWLLHWTLKLRYLSLAGVAALVALAVGLLMGPMRVDTRFELHTAARIYVELPEVASSLDALEQRVAPVATLVGQLPKDLVEYSHTTLGWAYTPTGKVRGWKYAQIDITPPGSFVEQEEKTHVIQRRLRQRLAAMEKKESFARLRFYREAAGETRGVVTIYVSGGDRIAFTEIQQRIRDTVKRVENVEDVYMDEARFQRAFAFEADESKVLAYELTKKRLQAQLRQHFARRELLRIRQRGEEIDVFLGFQQPEPPTMAALDALTVISGRGVAVPLKHLGRWRALEVLRRIEHQDLLRVFEVDVVYDAKKIKTKAVTAAIEKQLAPLRAAFPGYHISVKPSEHEAKQRQWMLQLVLVCVGAIYLCLALALGSLVQPIVVIFAIPFGFIGVVLAFYLHGMTLGIMAIIGILGLAGVVVNDSLVMTSTINHVFRADPAAGMRAAVLEGATRRLRAVVLTSLTTLGGVFPLAYGVAGRAGWLQPMVLAVGWGLLVATLLTLFFIPCLLLMIDDIGRLGRWGGRLARRMIPRRAA